MAFAQKTWKDRVAEYINRRILTKEDGTTELVSVERSEGTISQEGDAFSAENMNDLEQRIANEFSEQNKNLEECFQSVSDGKAMVASAITDKGVSTASDATFATMAEHIGAISTGLSLKKIYGCSSKQKKCTLDNLTVGKPYLVIISSFSSQGWNTAQSTYAKISSYTGCTLTELFYTNDASNSASRFYKMVPTATSVTLTAAANETATWTVCE